jgi:hypothetical protein
MTEFSPLELMFMDTFFDEAKEFAEEKGFELTRTKEPVEAEIGGRHEIPGEYELKQCELLTLLEE